MSATRAISLDVVEDLTTDSFIAAFLGFCAKFVVPKIIWSDKALYLQKGEILINKILSNSNVFSHFEQNFIKYKFIPVKSPWYGSIRERNIKIIKKCIKKSVGLRRLNLFELLTLLEEVENVVNNRPLTYVSDDINSNEPLTPNHLLKGHAINCLPENLNLDDISFLLDRNFT